MDAARKTAGFTSLKKRQSYKVTIYKTQKLLLYMNIKLLKIFLRYKGGGETELSFKECVRFIDTRPEMHPSWKKEQILYIATLLGFFGV